MKCLKESVFLSYSFFIVFIQTRQGKALYSQMERQTVLINIATNGLVEKSLQRIHKHIFWMIPWRYFLIKCMHSGLEQSVGSGKHLQVTRPGQLADEKVWFYFTEVSAVSGGRPCKATLKIPSKPSIFFKPTVMVFLFSSPYTLPFTLRAHSLKLTAP